MSVISNIAAGVALIVSLLAIVTFLATRRKAAIEEGRHLENVNSLGKELNHAYDKVHALENVSHDRDLIVGEIKADVKHLLEGMRRIEGKLDGHILGTPPT